MPLLDFIPPRRRRLVGWVVGLLLAYTLLGFLILPPIIRAIAVKQISKQLGREVSIQKLRLNPFVLSATIRGLLIKDNDGHTFVSWDEVYANFQLVSFFVHPWVFKEVSTTKPFVRVQVNKDYTFNFSDLVTKFSTNSPSKEPSKPLALRIDRFRIHGASASLTDLTPRTPFQRTLGPVDVTLVNFQTDPANKNPYSIAGTTDAGEKFSWSGYFYLDPLRSKGEFSLENFSLSKYAPLYQDFVKFRVTDGIAGLHSTYHFEVSSNNCVAGVTNTSAGLRLFKLAESETGPEIVSLPEFAVSGVSADTQTRHAEVGSVSVNGAKVLVHRDKNNDINFVKASKPAEPGANTPAGVLLLFKGLTNAEALFLNTTNTWTGAVRDVQFHDCGLQVEDLANARPVRLNLDGIEFSAKNISNLPGTNLTASLSLRWNTNGTVKTDVRASLAPLAADIHIGLDQLELKPLDPYLEPKLDVFIRGSKLSMDSRIQMREGADKLPAITYQGDIRLDDFATVDGVLEEDLLKWSSVRLSGIDAKLDPPEVNIKEISVDDAYAHAVIETNHTINVLAALRMSDTNAAPLAEQGPADKKKSFEPKTELVSISAETNSLSEFPLPKISIGSVVISNAQFHFTDRSVSPSVNLSIQQVGGTITGLSTEESGHADLAMHASVDNVGPVEVTGKLNLPSLRGGSDSTGSPPGTNEIKIAVKNVDLTPTSPYLGRFAGYRLEQGKLNMDLNYHILNRRLQSENLIVLDRFTFGDKVNSPDATRLPVRLAVAILKDRDGKIKLDVPIEGHLDDPEFRLRKVIVHALMNVITDIATSPFSALGAVFGGRGEELSYQDFAPGSAALQNPDKLDSLAKGMFERPGLQLEIQGSVDPDADREGLRQLAVEKQLQNAKWMTLRKSERETLKPEQATLTPDERLRLLKQFYGDALSKGEIPPDAISKATGGSAEASAQLLASLRKAGPEKGATMLMKKSAAGPAATQAKPSTASEGGLAGTLGQILANSVTITDSDFQGLASARAKAVREYLVQNGKVEPERVMPAENSAEGVKSQGSRAYLQFR